jgi:small subunit ribosomal protein S20
MANIKSQMKRNRTNERRRVRNKSVRSRVRTFTRQFHELADSGDVPAATEALRRATRELDKAASKGVLHANSAANHKAALARRLNQIASA